MESARGAGLLFVGRTSCRDNICYLLFKLFFSFFLFFFFFFFFAVEMRSILLAIFLLVTSFFGSEEPPLYSPSLDFLQAS